MAISQVGNILATSSLNGADVTLTFSTAPSAGDLVIIWGGHTSTRPTPIGPSTAGYALWPGSSVQTATTNTFGVWYKLMGATPDTTVVGQGTGNAADSTGYGSIVLRGVETVNVRDVVATFANGNSTNPDPGSITPATTGAAVVICAGCVNNDSAWTAPANYSAAVAAGSNDTNPYSIGGSVRLTGLTAGTPEDPAAFTGVLTSIWIAATIAVRPLTSAWLFPTTEAQLLNRSLLAQRGSATIGRSQFRSFNLQPVGFDAQAPQPPRPRRERGAALMRGDDGNLNVTSPPPPPPPTGWDVAPVQPPHPRPERFAATAPRDDGIQLPFALWRNAGWEVQPVQPPRRRWERAGAILEGDDGTESPFVQWYFQGWPIQPWQPPHPRSEKAAAMMRGIDGTDAPFAPSRPFPWTIDFQPYHRPVERSAAIARGDDGNEARFVQWYNAGWEVQPPPPPHPRPERFGALARGDDGNEAPFYQWRNVGWEVQPPQPPHPKPERFGALAKGDDGNEQVRINFFPIWPILDFEAPHPRPERAGAIMRGDDGNENVFTFLTQPPIWWEIQPLYPRQATEKRGASLRGDDGTADLFRQFYPHGWPVQPPQPPHPRPEKAGAVLKGDDGNQGGFTQFYPYGWFVQPPQPPHPRPERGGAPLAGDSGIEAPFVPAGTFPTAWGLPFEPTARRITRTLADRDDGIASPFQVWRNHGFDAQPVQPPRRRPVDVGPWTTIVDLLAPARQISFGWFVAPVQPGHPRPEKSGAIARGDDGTSRPFSRWFNAGWEVQHWQPPHPRPEARHAATARGDDGFAAPFIYWLVAGWEVQPVQPPHFAPGYRFGALARGDDGIEFLFRLPANVAFSRTLLTARSSVTMVAGWGSRTRIVPAKSETVVR